MTTISEQHRPALFRLAVAMAATSLLPIVIGALVTTLNAGMAFRDWPTSDGQGIFAFAWLQSTGDKFIEHGHRLAGILIGCVCIVFVAATWMLEPRRWVRWCAAGVLSAVVAQGLLGGGRVLADERLYAMLHGAFAAAVFAFMSSMAFALSRSWLAPPALPAGTGTGALKILAVLTPWAIVVQYSLGGLIRHRGTALYEHAAMAAVVVLFVAVTAIAAARTRCGWLERPAYLMGLLVVGQAALGAGSWITKYGFASVGYVAVERSPLQVAVRTSHTVVAMLLLAASVILLLRVLRIEWLARAAVRPLEHSAAAVHPAGWEGLS